MDATTPVDSPPTPLDSVASLDKALKKKQVMLSHTKQVLKMQQLKIIRCNSLLMQQQLEIIHNNSVLMKQRSEISSNSNGKSPDGGKGWVADCLTKRLEAEKLAKAQTIVCEGKSLDQKRGKDKSKDKCNKCEKLGHHVHECKQSASSKASDSKEGFVHDCGFVQPTAA